MMDSLATHLSQLLMCCWTLSSAVVPLSCKEQTPHICLTPFSLLLLLHFSPFVTIFFLFYHTYLRGLVKRNKSSQNDSCLFPSAPFPTLSFALLFALHFLSWINIKQLICEDSHSSESLGVISISHWSCRSETSPSRDFHHKRKCDLLLRLLVFQLRLLLALGVEVSWKLTSKIELIATTIQD